MQGLSLQMQSFSPGRVLRHDARVRLVPRQLRKSSFPSSVPYYGGRLTPQVIQGMKTNAAPPPPPPPPPPPLPPDPAQELARLEDLRAKGYVTPAEYDEIRRRITRQA
jgi:hypothetical protein